MPVSLSKIREVSMGHISSKEQDRILAFCVEVLQRLGMPSYELVLSDEPSDEGTDASIASVPGRYAATLRVCKRWDSLPKSEKVNTLVHEMLHLTHADLVQDAMLPLEFSPSVSSDLRQAVRGILDMGTERWVDRMSYVIAEGMTYPKKVKGKAGQG
ncbi:hypothetical protein N8J89_08065 [Crossiella sp. CA-258035]|uniref:hypothetical protein n=1 Tax=Crossiella sp. CA-258035 TaxID=2981138 RepID=UPI0024BC223B|nr:hypothetical protein [Crossiella sp. CA-258035]WHT21010.1 hypothetical protein N8J89_08065 [Crossiella sp. CA-258035]